MKIGILSFAHPHAASYARVLAGRPGVEVVGADPGHAERPPGEVGGPALAAALGVGYVETYAELLAGEPDGVIICAENARHRELVELATAGTPGRSPHILCEKPLATTLADARAMIDRCAVAAVHLMVAYPVRFSTAFSALRSVYDSGGLGRLAAATGTNNGRIPVGDRAWFVDDKLAGGGALMDHTVHVADLLDCLFGERAEDVYAVANHILHRDRVRVETGGLVSIRYAGGLVATIDCSWSKPDSFPTWGGLTLQLVGSGGIADLDAFGARVEGHSEGQRNGIWLPYGPDADQALITEFLDAVADGRRPQPDGEAGYRSLEIALAGYASLRTGQPVRLR